MTRVLFLLLAMALPQCIWAQQTPVADSAINLSEMVITAFEQNRVVNCGTIVKMVTANNIGWQNKVSFVNALNSVAGVRMEERSPGSYRINIRGSSLRSPFGVRNVKVYWNGIPVTDPGGNTYFNQFAFNNFFSAEIIKGPAGSMYGAGTGGVLLLHSAGNTWQPGVTAEYIMGSYGLHNLLASVHAGTGNNHNSFTYAHNESDGYRNHTASKKDNASFVAHYKLSDKQEITASVLYSNLWYQTPGALTKAEFITDPKQSRPAAGGLPSAAAARATIYQQNFIAGITQQYHFSTGFKNTLALYGNIAQVQNPTFRNYERRNEPGYGGRTSFVYEIKNAHTTLQLVAGGELQQGFFNTLVSNNKNGNPDTVQTNDDIRYTNFSLFSQADVSFKNGFIITAGINLSNSSVNFKRLNKYPVLLQGRRYSNNLSPRLALQKKAGNGNTVFASISRGFSPPTIAELLPSTGVISTFLEAEQGINYELGTKFSALKNKLHAEATAFYFKLDDALVSRKDSSNADYYVNAGNTKQEGIELSADYGTGFKNYLLKYLVIRSAVTLNHFRYGSFQKGTSNFTGKELPGVPKSILAVSADLQFIKGIYCSSTFSYIDKTFLDDANTAVADHYQLLGCRLGCKIMVKQKIKINLYAGADNLLNETYSLGNDFNAAAGRYYNAAPQRNYYAGIAFQLLSSQKK